MSRAQLNIAVFIVLAQVVACGDGVSDSSSSAVTSAASSESASTATVTSTGANGGTVGVSTAAIVAGSGVGVKRPASVELAVPVAGGRLPRNAGSSPTKTTALLPDAASPTRAQFT